MILVEKCAFKVMLLNTTTSRSLILGNEKKFTALMYAASAITLVRKTILDNKKGNRSNADKFKDLF